MFAKHTTRSTEITSHRGDGPPGAAVSPPTLSTSQAGLARGRQAKGLGTGLRHGQAAPARAVAYTRESDRGVRRSRAVRASFSSRRAERSAATHRTGHPAAGAGGPTRDPPGGSAPGAIRTRLSLPSPGRHTTELQATGILLEAELRAAEILNATADQEGGLAGPEISSIGADVARAIEHHLQALAEVEKSLIELGTKSVAARRRRGHSLLRFLRRQRRPPGRCRAGGRTGSPGGGVFPAPGPCPSRVGKEPL